MKSKLCESIRHRAWEHKQDVHSVKVHLLPDFPSLWALRGICNPSFSTDQEESKVMYVVLETQSSKPVFCQCTCTIGLRGDCSHVGAILFTLCDVVAEGKQHLPPDPTCTDLPCSWSDPKGAKVEPVIVEDINFYKAKVGKEPPTKKFHPSPSVTESFYGTTQHDKRTMDELKMNLKRDLFYANHGNPMPPIFYILAQKDILPQSPLQQELPDFLPADDPHLAYSVNVDIEDITEHENVRTIVSPIKSNPDSLHDITSKADAIIDKLRVQDDDIKKIEKATRDQSNCKQWFVERTPRITASQCKRALMKETTSPTKAVSEILGYNNKIQTGHMRDGICSEGEIIEQYMKITNNKVQKSGFFVSKTHPFLGASPDGLIDDDGSIEVKKIHPHYNETLEAALKRLHIVKDVDGCLIVNENHKYYYQMQQQLFCTGRRWTDFVASDGTHLFVRRVDFNEDFWNNNLPKLKKFFYNILLLELAYPRVKYGIERIGKLGIEFSTLASLRQI